VTAYGHVVASPPVGQFTGPLNVPSPLPRKTETTLDDVAAAAMSGLPSPVRSAAAIPYVPLALESVTGARSVPSPFPSKTETEPAPLTA
jgi:hypothetical protein